jgi:cell division protein FtsZ
MSRPRRASMREGPLADLFRSTTDDARKETARGSDRTPAGPVTEQGSPARPPETPDSAPPARERIGGPSADRAPSSLAGGTERTAAAEPDQSAGVYDQEGEAAGRQETAPERLKRVFSEQPEPRRERRPDQAVDTPRYGREEPAYEPQGSGTPHKPVIRVVGVGGAGVNAVNRMVEAHIPGVEFMAVNTDLQSLQLCVADVTVHIGEAQTRGLGAGADAEVGHRSAFEEQDKIKRLLKGSDMVFVAVGAGGGTGTGAAPVIARLAREIGALTVGIVTKPFSFEGSRRGNQARKGIEALAEEVDTLIVVPNDRLLEVLDQQTSMVEAFQVADDVLRQGVQGISDLVTLPALINLDFADVRTIMSEAGRALLGIGMGSGEGRALLAAEKAISSPLLETSMEGARAILLSITGGPDLSLVEVSEAAKLVGEAAHADANIIFGANVDEALTDQIWVTVVATRFDGRGAPARRLAEPTIRRTKDVSRGRGGRVQSPGELGSLDVPEFLPG